MATEVKLFDYSGKVKAGLEEAAIAWLHTWGNEMASQAQRTCQMDGDTGVQLRASYDCKVDESAKEAAIGTPLESGYWEEYGTGEHAVDKSKSRRGWWVYTPDDPGPPGYKSGVYADELEAGAVAAFIQRKYGKRAIVTNGRDPHHTLENAYKVTLPKAKADLPKEVNEKLGGGST